MNSETLNWNDLNNNYQTNTSVQIPMITDINSDISKSSIDNLILNSNNLIGGAKEISESSFHNVFTGGANYDFDVTTSINLDELAKINTTSEQSTLTGFEFASSDPSSKSYSLSALNLDNLETSIDNTFNSSSTSFGIDFEETTDSNQLYSSDIDIISLDENEMTF
tara:strand:+ start:214 stop:711 length:498 start_codon:yes stop_codon:yes gene_type:complete